MLEELIKALLCSVLIAFFLITCLRVSGEALQAHSLELKYSESINELSNTSFQPESDGFRIVKGNGSLVVCKPALLNNLAGRVCIES